MVLVILENITKIFPSNVVALDGINLRIKSGEFFVTLGPSGSGKTTLLRIIAGLEKPTKGRVIIGDKVVVDVEKKVFVEPGDRNIGMVFQNWALYPHMTVYDNIAFPLQIKKVPKQEIDRRVKEVAEALDIYELLNRKPSQISGGQQQRVAVARALVKQPDVLLLDEPFSNLDARIRVTAREFVREIQKTLGITTILVTHDQADAFAVGDRIMVLKNGKIQQVGTARQLYDKPVNLFVANFIGNPPMNIIKLVPTHPIIKALNLKDIMPKDNSLIYLGIRPDEALAVVETDNAHMVGKIKIVEYVGARKYVKVETEHGFSIKVLAGENVNENQKVGILVKNVHVFDSRGIRLESVTY